MNLAFKISAIFLFCLAIISCSTPSNNEKATASVPPSNNNITITGEVKSIENGKDGYTAQIQSKEDKMYAALVSIVNLGGPDNYTRFNIGDKVTVSGTSRPSTDVTYLKVEKIVDVSSKTHSQLLISTTSFRGIMPGDKITDHTDYIQKETMRTGEGSFDIYRIKDFNNNPAGYFMADPKDDALVGNITVEAPTANTIDGIHIGSTFGELKDKVLAIEVHGSEVEGRTYLNYNNLSYRLDVANFTYEVNAQSIPASTKITEIVVNRGIQSTETLYARYQAKSPKAFCWLVNDAIELYDDSNRTSKKLGAHFKGETLKILDSKFIKGVEGKQLWVQVQFTNSIKAGYEDRFADGKVWPSSGQTLGWIDGDGQPLISCN